jgi:hypothetical protein
MVSRLITQGSEGPARSGPTKCQNVHLGESLKAWRERSHPDGDALLLSSESVPSIVCYSHFEIKVYTKLYQSQGLHLLNVSTALCSIKMSSSL